MSIKGNIIFIGGGNMAKAIINGLLENNYSKESILVIDSSAKQLQTIKNEYAVNTASVLGNINKSDLIILATKPDKICEVCNNIKDKIDEHLVISIAAGISISKISYWLRNHKNIVRTMPNLLGKIKRSVTGLCAHKELHPTHKEIANNIMASIRKNLWLDNESKIDAVTAISGSGPAYVFYFLNSLIESGKKIGLSKEEAQFFAKETLIGSAIMSEDHINDLDTLIKSVSSKGWTTEQAINVMKNHQFDEIISIAVNEAFKRSKEIGS